MLIFNQGNWIVLQHPHSQIFHILKWSGRDYIIQNECGSIAEVKAYLQANM